MIEPRLTYTYYSLPNDAGLYGRVSIAARDTVTQALVSATGTVTYAQTIDNTTRVIQLSFNGQQVIQIYDGLLSANGYATKWLIRDYNFRTTAVVDEPVYSPCNLIINNIQQTKPESAPGAHDAAITVSATSSYGIQYSINGGASWQNSRNFSGLSGGLLQVMVKDANPEGCTKQASITITTLRSLLVADPGVQLGDNISRWNAAFNPIVFTYQRRDLEVTAITNEVVSGISKPKLLLSGNATSIKAGELIYADAGLYKGTFKVLDAGAGFIVLDDVYTTNTGLQTGFINSNTLRPYYKVLTRITSTHPETGAIQTITATNRPDGTGLVRADISNFLQSLLLAKDDSDYTRPNYRDSNLSASYQIAYAEDWDGKQTSTGTPQFIAIAQPWYVVYAAKQLGDKYGGNLAAYVPFQTAATPARWLTDFAEPAYSNGYPFDIGFLYGEDMLGLPLYCEFTPLDINRQPLGGDAVTAALLNEDGSWLLNQDDSRLLISRLTISGNMQVPAQLGLNRLLINSTFAAEAYYVAIQLKYDDDDGSHAITRQQIIRIDKAIDDNAVYLRWIGLSGSWEYYRFVYNQEVSLDVQNAVIIKNYVADWQNQQGIEEVISKTAGQKIKVMAEDLSIADIKGLQAIKYSPKVQLLVNKNPVKWQTVVVNTATYSEYETRNGQGPFSITFSLPAINVQAQ